MQTKVLVSPGMAGFVQREMKYLAAILVAFMALTVANAVVALVWGEESIPSWLDMAWTAGGILLACGASFHLGALATNDVLVREIDARQQSDS